MSDDKKVPPSGTTIKPETGRIVEGSYTGPKITLKVPLEKDESKKGK